MQEVNTVTSCGLVTITNFSQKRGLKPYFTHPFKCKEEFGTALLRAAFSESHRVLLVAWSTRINRSDSKTHVTEILPRTMSTMHIFAGVKKRDSLQPRFRGLRTAKPGELHTSTGSMARLWTANEHKFRIGNLPRAPSYNFCRNWSCSAARNHLGT